MTNEEFRKAIIEALYAGPPFDTYNILVEYRNGGGKQAKAHEILKEMLFEVREAEVEEKVEDAVLDTMEHVVGDVAPYIRVWPDRLKT